jgi:hypothetical protein
MIMKKTCLATLVCVVVLMAGCAQFERALYDAQTITVRPAEGTNAAIEQVVLSPKQEVAAATQLIGALPIPWSGLAGFVIGLLLTGYSAWKNKQVASAIVESVEAGRKFLQTTPDGQKIDAAFRDELVKQQTFLGVIATVKKICDALKK